MTVSVSRIPMPNDPKIVDPDTGMLTPAWLHYLGQLKALADEARLVAEAVNDTTVIVADHETRITALEP